MAVSISHRLGPRDDAAAPALLAVLADGRPHRAEELAAALEAHDESPGAVPARVAALRALGIEVREGAAPGQAGYFLPEPVELLDAALIGTEFDPASAAAVRGMEILFETGSTNTRLLAAPAPPDGRADICLAELQSAGRGRRGRRWIAPFGSGLTLSLAWTFREAVRDLPSLSLAVGVAIARALSRTGARGIALKWPNDIWCGQKKIGGVLVELRADSGGSAHVVIGIGMNVVLPPRARHAIESGGGRADVAAVADACAEPPSRNRIAGAILDESLRMLPQFAAEGFGPFRDEWSALDAARGRKVHVSLGERLISGRACGVGADGALRVDVGGRMQDFVSGEVSVCVEGS